jgi:hypothetical protein
MIFTELSYLVWCFKQYSADIYMILDSFMDELGKEIYGIKLTGSNYVYLLFLNIDYDYNMWHISQVVVQYWPVSIDVKERILQLTQLLDFCTNDLS